MNRKWYREEEEESRVCVKVSCCEQWGPVLLGTLDNSKKCLRLSPERWKSWNNYPPTPIHHWLKAVPRVLSSALCVDEKISRQNHRCLQDTLCLGCNGESQISATKSHHQLRLTYQIS